MAKLKPATLLFHISFSWLLFNNFLAEPVWAGRPIFNATPQTIERYFGRYQTRLTTSAGVTYTYSPQEIRQLFPQFQQTNWSITFVNNRAKFINLDVNPNENADDFTYGQNEASKFFQYVFGYQPPTWQEQSRQFTGNETIYEYEYCLGDGVATSFMQMGYKQFADFIQLYYNPQCESSALNSKTR